MKRYLQDPLLRDLGRKMVLLSGPRQAGKTLFTILESLNIIFAVRPFHANVARAIQKEPKIYFQDSGHVDGDEGDRLENTVAVSLKKHVSWLQDVMGVTVGLHYVRTKEHKEVDFALVESGIVKTLIEVRLSESVPASGLRQPQTIDSIHVVGAAGWLASLSA